MNELNQLQRQKVSMMKIRNNKDTFIFKTTISWMTFLCIIFLITVRTGDCFTLPSASSRSISSSHRHETSRFDYTKDIDQKVEKKNDEKVNVSGSGKKSE